MAIEAVFSFCAIVSIISSREIRASGSVDSKMTSITNSMLSPAALPNELEQFRVNDINPTDFAALETFFNKM